MSVMGSIFTKVFDQETMEECGAQTALAAQQCGLHVAAQADTAETLLPLLPADKTYFYPSGAHVSHDFAQFDIIRAVAYSAEAATMLSAPALHAIGRGRRLR